ncbi:type II toxin-antitoxin system Phd/YefM family antitoxin [Streptomyces himalayensis]|uniref:Antitoxin n=2 Tax=Streptomyces himalayensis TaxID=2820085 RepID=A0A7W2HKB4_9ACTN|nr:type II toxin-antitoxin system prevent-host-death family antitoxin [Streptomyces himalayensis]MBA2944825.1 type II toxin-antitoxin system prevent-host-death family antitoxin [Streptomyces himalayensis subsp. himalayensis]MBA4866968.1 type II toxin-antitoxin system prevent-host-death family antitoxin [Streptomyces himalayensis subsp. aureolus]
MDRIPVRELNQNTSAVLARVQRGESLEVTVKGTAVARLVPITTTQSLLDRLVAEGRATAPTTSGPVPMPPTLGDPAVEAAAELAAMRDEERW